MRVNASYDTPLHTHDFAEVFWVEKGEGLHHVNGDAHRLRAGSLITIRPDDAHAFQTSNDEGFVLVNLAFERSVLDFIGQRYSFADRFFWARTPMPWGAMVSDAQLAWLGRGVEALSVAPQQQIELDHFLLGLLRELSAAEPRARTLPDGLPTWIEALLQRVHQPEHFSRGARHVAELAHRAPEHVTRELKRHTGLTTIAWVNKARLDYAERQLRMTTEEINQIALACGYDSLAHFYKVFRARFGLTPAAYRARHQAVLR